MPLPLLADELLRLNLPLAVFGDELQRFSRASILQMSRCFRFKSSLPLLAFTDELQQLKRAPAPPIY